MIPTKSLENRDFGMQIQKIGASGGAAQAAEARSCVFDAGELGLEHDPRPKITKVLTRRKLKITKVAKALGQTQKL